MRGVLDSVQDIVQRGRDAVDVLGIDGGDEGLVQAVKYFVDDFVALMLQNGNFRGGAGQPRVAGTNAVEQDPRGLGDNLHLF